MQTDHQFNIIEVKFKIILFYLTMIMVLWHAPVLDAIVLFLKTYGDKYPLLKGTGALNKRV